MREVDLASFAGGHSTGAVVVDVREPGEYTAGHVPGARLMPLGHLPDRVGELPRDERIYVICASGNRSKAAADFLAGAGIDAVSVAGGTAGWANAGRSVVFGTQPTA
jgi:rhodanese-related sulfurtransferase